jgi:hypothetical protein
MIDTVMESIIDAIDKFWFRLNLRFDIENSEIFMAMQRFWNHALENPVILLIAAMVLIGISMTLSKLRRAKKTQEKNVDWIIENLETNEDQEKPLFPEEIATPLAIDEDADVRVFNKFMGPGEGEDPATAIENVSSMHNPLVDDSWDTSDLLPPAGFKAEESGMHSESPTRKRFGEDIPELAHPDGNRIEASEVVEEDATAQGNPETPLEEFTPTQATVPDEAQNLKELLGLDDNQVSVEISETIAEIEDAIEEIHDQSGEELHQEIAAAEIIEPVVESIEGIGLAEEPAIEEELSIEEPVEEPANTMGHDEFSVQEIHDDSSITEEPPVIEEVETQEEVVETPAESPVAAEEPAQPQGNKKSDKLLERLLKMQTSLENRVQHLNVEPVESPAEKGTPSTTEENKVLETTNENVPSKSSDQSSEEYQQLLQSYFLTGKQDKSK